MLCCIILIFPSEGFSVVSQSSVGGYSQLPLPAASQTHLRSGTEGKWETSVKQSQQSYHITTTTMMMMMMMMMMKKCQHLKCPGLFSCFHVNATCCCLCPSTLKNAMLSMYNFSYYCRFRPGCCRPFYQGYVQKAFPFETTPLGEHFEVTY